MYNWCLGPNSTRRHVRRKPWWKHVRASAIACALCYYDLGMVEDKIGTHWRYFVRYYEPGLINTPSGGVLETWA